MDSLPPAVLVPLVTSYMKGALVSSVAYKQGGWKAVDELYKHPPESTEQTLHPETKLFPTRDIRTGHAAEARRHRSSRTTCSAR